MKSPEFKVDAMLNASLGLKLHYKYLFKSLMEVAFKPAINGVILPDTDALKRSQGV